MSRLLISTLLVSVCLTASAADPKAKAEPKAEPVYIDPAKLAAVSSFDRGMELLNVATSETVRKEAMDLIIGAASVGYPDAQYFVGLVDEKSLPVQAREWFRKAAEAGHVKAARKLALMLEEGRGGAVDKEGALKWHKVAAEGGMAKSAVEVARVTEKEGPAEIKEAVKYYEKAAESGDSEADIRLGDIYFKGGGIQQNLYQAYKYYLAAAQLKNPKAYFKLGYCYERGHGIGQSYQEAVHWYQLGVDAGDLNCIANLARFYETGVSVDKDTVKAAELFERAAQAGEPFSQLSLGSMYRSGTGVKQDLVEAYKWISLAVQQGFGNEILVLLEKQMTPDQITEGKRVAANFKVKKK